MYILRDRCQFRINKVVFSVPKDYSIDAKETDLEHDVLCFWHPDKSFVARYKLVCDNVHEDIKEELSKPQMFIFDTCQPIEEIEHNGMKGYATTYGDEKEQYYEAIFIIKETNNFRIAFAFSIITYHGDIKRIKVSPEFRELFDSIWRKDRKKYKINKPS
ncbi:MAG: hypothetical protein HFE78_02530 [Clostridiales bacterium]|nr:hypothetical protein [Clostridiales bacterium]